MQDLVDQLYFSNHNSKTCLETAAKAVADLALRGQLQAYAKTHENIMQQLAQMATQLHLSASQRQLHDLTASMPGRSTFQYALVTKDRYAILAECQERLRDTLERYDEILHAKLPQWVSDTFRAQSSTIERSYHHIYRMCVQAQSQFSRRANKRSTLDKQAPTWLRGKSIDPNEPLAIN